MSIHLYILFVRSIGYAALATALVYLVLVIRTGFPPTRARLFTFVHFSMAAVFYILSILAVINLGRYAAPPITPSLIVMDFVLTPLILGSTIASWMFALRQTRKKLYIKHIASLL